MSDGTALGDRMKAYEAVAATALTRRMPAVIRVDGKAFHTLTRGMNHPWDEKFAWCMRETATQMCREIHGAKLAYVQSDEISVVVTDYDTLQTDGWFGYKVQKMASVAAAMATGWFGGFFHTVFEHPDRPPLFDGRVFVVPHAEVVNYLIWRQRDATRNSIQMLAHHHLSQGECHGLNGAQLQEAVFQRTGINWNDTPTYFKRGGVVRRVPVEVKAADGQSVTEHWWQIDESPPIFTENREYVVKMLPTAEAYG